MNNSNYIPNKKIYSVSEIKQIKKVKFKTDKLYEALTGHNKNKSHKSTDFIFAIDLGGTSAKCALANMMGSITHKFSVPTGFGEEVIPNIYHALLKKIENLNINYEQIKYIGFGCKGPFNNKTGVIINAGDLGWYNYPAKTIAEKTFDRKVFLTNDSRSATIGEWKRGAGKKYKSFVCLTLGQGIGGGIILDNKLWNGAHNMSGEVGHGGFLQNSRDCGCGLPYCAEGLSSAKGIEWYFDVYAHENPSSSIAKLKTSLGRRVTLKDASKLIKSSDSDCMRALQFSLKPVAERISTLIFTLDIEAILIGGGPSALGSKILEPIKYWLKQCTWKTKLETTDLKVCQLGNDAGIIGVVEFVLDSIKNGSN